MADNFGNITRTFIVHNLSIFVSSAAFFFLYNGITRANEISNSVLAIGISGTHGSAIDSLRVVGEETVNNADLGRSIQNSHFFAFTNFPSGVAICNGPLPPWANLQDGGDQCGHPSMIYAIGNDKTHLNVRSYPKEWATGRTMAGLRFETHVTLGPLPYANANEVAQIKYQVYWDSVYSGQKPLTFLHAVNAANGNTPVGFIPAIYFDDSKLNRLFGLSLDGSAWQEFVPNDSPDGTYSPSNYRFRAMAWMRRDLGWGVALYGRSTLNQDCHGVSFPMALPAQAHDCPNFAAQTFHRMNTVNLSLVDQTATVLAPGEGKEFVIHAFVGNLPTIQDTVNQVYQSGN